MTKTRYNPHYYFFFFRCDRLRKITRHAYELKSARQGIHRRNNVQRKKYIFFSKANWCIGFILYSKASEVRASSQWTGPFLRFSRCHERGIIMGTLWDNDLHCLYSSCGTLADYLSDSGPSSLYNWVGSNCRKLSKATCRDAVWRQHRK